MKHNGERTTNASYDIVDRLEEELGIVAIQQSRGWGFAQSTLQDAIREITQLRANLSEANRELALLKIAHEAREKGSGRRYGHS